MTAGQTNIVEGAAALPLHELPRLSMSGTFDLLSGIRVVDLTERSAQMLSTVAPLIGPFVGAQIMLHAQWRMIFWLLVGIGVVVLVALYSLPETLSAERRMTQLTWQTFTGYGELLRNPRLLGYAAAGGFFYMGIFANVAGLPFAYISYCHVAPRLYGFLFRAGVIDIMATNQINRAFVPRVGSERCCVAGRFMPLSQGSRYCPSRALTGEGWPDCS